MGKIKLSEPVWGKGKSKEKNCTLAFVYDIKSNCCDEYRLFLSASDMYRLFVDEKLIGYGPARSAHDCARVDDYKILGKGKPFRITVEVVSYQVNSYNLTLESPFFDALLKLNNKIIATSWDFACYELIDRVKKVQRFSFQRPFIESVRYPQRRELYLGESNDYPIIDVEKADKKEYLERNVGYPTLEKIYPIGIIEKGKVVTNFKNEIWRDRSIVDIGDKLMGYKFEELEEKISDTVCSFDYVKDSSSNDFYNLYEFSNIRTGLIELSVSVLEECDVYLVFEEILNNSKDLKQTSLCEKLCFHRGECANIIKYKLKKGEYSLTSFEPYTLKYLNVVCVGGKATVNEVALLGIESSKLTFSSNVDDIKVQKIIDAALNTYKQNSLDLLMDCPGRERAGWINDSFFSSESDRLFSGTRTVEANFIENIFMAPDLEHIPKGILPMCYPCDHNDGNFSPTCSMWFVLEVCKYCCDKLKGKMPDRYKKRIERFMEYLSGFLNEDGLLEDLKGWVFIEWSRANDADVVCGVNYPSNMLYARMLCALGSVWNDEQLSQEGTRIIEVIRKQSFNGTFFEDNKVRRAGTLVETGNVTETCQYFAFFLGIATKEDYPELFENLISNFAYSNTNADLKGRNRSNIIVGLILRETLLLQAGEVNKVVDECKSILYKMADITGTLWENVDSRASCNHNIASYFAVLMIYAITGYRGVSNGEILIKNRLAGIDGVFNFEYEGLPICINVKNNKTTVESKLSVRYF